eukprot:1649834-Pyramimonas_sp.AAC.1
MGIPCIICFRRRVLNALPCNNRPAHGANAAHARRQPRQSSAQRCACTSSPQQAAATELHA